MNLAQAIAYFLREAVQNLLVGWRVALVAVFSIAVSLLTGGGFVLISGNVARLLDEWTERARLVIYLEEGVTPAEREALEARLAAAPAVETWEEVDSRAAAARLADSFPSLAPLLEEQGSVPLPASVEARVDRRSSRGEEWGLWLSELAALPGVEDVDDDEDWIRQMEGFAGIAGTAGLALGGVLMAAAILTIASVVRLTVYNHREEVATLRLVGATEFFIRGPFYAEGLLQGLLGGTLALGGLLALHGWARATLPGVAGPEGPLGRFLAPQESVALVVLGGLAGLVGAVLSLRRESLGVSETGENPLDI